MAASPAAVALAQALAQTADNKKAEDIVVLDVSEQHSLIDCFVIATATSDKHARVVAEVALEHVKSLGQAPWHLETSPDWVLGDFGDVVIHVFTPQAREYYDLEHLWADATRVTWTRAPDAVSA